MLEGIYLHLPSRQCSDWQGMDVDNRLALYERISLAGGSTLFPGMQARVQRDIRAFYCTRIVQVSLPAESCLTSFQSGHAWKISTTLWLHSASCRVGFDSLLRKQLTHAGKHVSATQGAYCQ